MKIEAIGFDLDDTLYDRDVIYEQVFNIMQLLLKHDRIEFEKFNQVYQKYSIIEYQAFQRKEKTKKAYQLDRVIRTYEFFNIAITTELAEYFNELYFYIRKHNVKVRPKVRLLLDFLHQQQIPVFLLTNGPSKDQREKIECLDLGKYFNDDNIFISDEMGLSKPDPQIFQAIQQQIGIEPEHIVYIGDNLKNDIQGCRAVKWQAIYLNITTEIHGDDTLPEFFHFSDIYDYIERQVLPSSYFEFMSQR